MKVLIALLGLASMACAYSDRRVDSIVGSVTHGYYDGAVRTTLELYRENRLDLIKEVIDGFFQNNVKNFLNYVYKLKQDGGGLIVQEDFPDEVRGVLDGRLVNLVNKQDGHVLKLGSTTDRHGNRKVFGEESVSNAFAWMFSPIWENDNLYFHLFNTEYSQYLKVGKDADLDDQRVAYSGDSPTETRYQWYLIPARAEGKNLFYIVNREYNQALKLGRSRNQDLVAYAQNSDYHDSEKFGWFVNDY